VPRTILVDSINSKVAYGFIPVVHIRRKMKKEAGKSKPACFSTNPDFHFSNIIFYYFWTFFPLWPIGPVEIRSSSQAALGISRTRNRLPKGELPNWVATNGIPTASRQNPRSRIA